MLLNIYIVRVLPRSINKDITDRSTLRVLMFRRVMNSFTFRQASLPDVRSYDPDIYIFKFVMMVIS